MSKQYGDYGFVPYNFEDDDEDDEDEKISYMVNNFITNVINENYEEIVKFQNKSIL